MADKAHPTSRQHSPNNERNLSRHASFVPNRGTVTMYEYSPQQFRESGLSPAILDLIAQTTVNVVTRRRGDRHSEDRKGIVMLVIPEPYLVHAIESPLNAAGAYSRRILVHSCRYRSEKGRRPMRLPDDAARLRNDILRSGADLVVIDPLNGLLADDAGSSEQQKIQRVRSALERIAAETNVAIMVGIAHTRAASPDISHDRARQIPTAGATTGIPPSSAVAYRPAQKPGATNADISLNVVAHRKVLEAIEFLRRVLARGPASRRDVEYLASLRGLKPRTLRTAREKLGIRVWKSQTANGPWVWELPFISAHDVRH